MTHTKALVSILRGVNLVMEPKAITSPRGIAKRRVTPKSFMFSKKPRSKSAFTAAKFINYLCVQNNQNAVLTDGIGYSLIDFILQESAL